MASLTGNSVGSSYLGLLKTTDNAAIDGNLKNMTDGAGNATPLSMGTNTFQIQADTIELIEPTGGTNLMMISPTNVYFEGAVDFTNASVTGIGGAGMVSGTGTDSVKSADSLTTNNATAAGARSIAIGDGANANSDGSIAIGSVNNVPPAPRPNYIAIGMDTLIAQNSIAMGTGANAQSDRGLAIGEGTQVFSDFGMSIGYNASASGYQQNQIVIGNGASSDSDSNIAIGKGASALGGGGFQRTNICIGTGTASNERSIAIGHNANGTGARSVAISESSNASGNRSIAIGQSSQSTGFNSIAAGAYSRAQAEGAFALGGPIAIATALNSGAIGRESTANLSGAVAIGYQVTTLWADGTTVNQLAMKNYAAINYADDTAAAAGGVPLGGVYHNAGALRIRIA